MGSYCTDTFLGNLSSSGGAGRCTPQAGCRMKVGDDDDAHPCVTTHGHKKINESTFKGSIMFSKTIVKSSCNARKITEEEDFCEDDSCHIPKCSERFCCSQGDNLFGGSSIKSPFVGFFC